MDGREMVVAIVAITMICWMVTEAAKHLAKRPKDEANPQADRRIQDLENRVAVLERLHTDPKERLKREIDAL